jgi:hypothetical protein
VRPVDEIVPEVEVRESAPVVRVNPFEAVSKPFEVKVEKVPDPAVPLPIAPGLARVAPPSAEALIVPEPEKFNEAPVPTTIAAVVFVPEVIALKAGVPPVLSDEHAQPPPSVHFKISLSAQPLSSVNPEEDTCRPELLEVDPVVPDVVRATSKVTVPDVPPPVKPLPAVTPSISPVPLPLPAAPVAPWGPVAPAIP